MACVWGRGDDRSLNKKCYNGKKICFYPCLQTCDHVDCVCVILILHGRSLGAHFKEQLLW